MNPTELDFIWVYFAIAWYLVAYWTEAVSSAIVWKDEQTPTCGGMRRVQVQSFPIYFHLKPVPFVNTSGFQHSSSVTQSYRAWSWVIRPAWGYDLSEAMMPYDTNCSATVVQIACSNRLASLILLPKAELSGGLPLLQPHLGVQMAEQEESVKYDKVLPLFYSLLTCFYVSSSLA